MAERPKPLLPRWVSLPCFAWSAWVLAWCVSTALRLIAVWPVGNRIVAPPPGAMPDEAAGAIASLVVVGLLVSVVLALIAALTAVRAGLAVLLALGGRNAWWGKRSSRALIVTWPIATVIVEGAVLVLTRGQEPMAWGGVVVAAGLIVLTCSPRSWLPERVGSSLVGLGKSKKPVRLIDDLA